MSRWLGEDSYLLYFFDIIFVFKKSNRNRAGVSACDVDDVISQLVSDDD